MRAALLHGQHRACLRGRFQLLGRIEPQDLASFFVATECQVQETGVAVLVLYGAPRPLRACLAIDDRRLGRLLRPFPGQPGFAFNLVQSLDFQFPLRIEVANGRLPPGDVNPFEIFADRRLRDSQFVGDLHLPAPLQVELGHLLAALGDCESPGGLDAHAGILLEC